MYNILDAPPPPSQLYAGTASSRHRPRPWSPDALPSGNDSREAFNLLQRRGDDRQDGFVEDYSHLPDEQFPRLRHRQEASEVSVEALDLADYARTLRSRQAEDPYPPFPSLEPSSNSRETRRQFQHSPVHPPSSFPNFTRGGTRTSVNTSSTATHRTPQSTHSLPAIAGSSRRRPFSVPSSPHQSSPHLAQEPDPEQEIDVTNFPSWSREWYNHDSNRSRRPPHNNLQRIEAYELEAGFVPPKAFLNGGSRTSLDKPFISPFDPAYIHPDSYPKNRTDIFDDNHSYPSYAAPSYSNHEPLISQDPNRDGVVPWSLDPPEYKNAPLAPHVKEERIRMLEQEFGSDKKKKRKGHEHGAGGDKHQEKDDGLLRDDDGKLIVGTPDGKGGLATQAPMLRASVRFLQFALTVGVGGPIIWAALKLKPNPAPPPAGKPPFFIMAVLAPVTFLLLCYLFIVRPCTVRRRYPALTHPGARGMMVIPVPGGGHGKKGKGSKGPGVKKGGKKGGAHPDNVQVNLIVDPTAFALPGEDDPSSSSSSELDDAGGFPNGYFDRNNNPNGFGPSSRRRERDRAKRKRNRRRTLVVSMKLEEEWRAARAWLRVVSFVDVAACVLWGVAFGLVIAGSRCPSGGEEKGYGGWCPAYNASTAAACLLCVAFAISLFFDVKDIYASKASPRTRV